MEALAEEATLSTLFLPLMLIRVHRGRKDIGRRGRIVFILRKVLFS